MSWTLRLTVEVDGVDDVDIPTLIYAMQAANPLAEFPVDDDAWAALHVYDVDVIGGPDDRD